jgi:hypothetical protein
MKYYIILERNWEYNDNTFEQSESDSGLPKHVYLDRSTAVKECFKLNKAKLAGLDIEMYDYPFNAVDLAAELPHLVYGDMYQAQISTLITDEDTKDIMSFIGKYPFYFIHTLEES